MNNGYTTLPACVIALCVCVCVCMCACVCVCVCVCVYSATWPPEVRRLTTSYMKDPFQVSVGSLDLRVSESVNRL